MSEYPETFDHMLAAWNERDPGKIRGHLERALADDVEFCDPQHHVTGLDAFEKMVRDFRENLPDAVCARTSGVDSHHNRFRYEWSVSSGGEVLVPGFDVVAVNADNRVERVDGFFGPLPPVPA
jgi:hypothetical protein